MRQLLVTGSLITALVITGCSKNPLKKMPSDEAARILINTCAEAMEVMGFHEQGISSRYAQCLEHRVNNGFDCNALYDAMSKNLVDQGIKVSSKQIQDASFYAQVQQDLKQRAFFSK